MSNARGVLVRLAAAAALGYIAQDIASSFGYGMQNLLPTSVLPNEDEQFDRRVEAIALDFGCNTWNDVSPDRLGDSMPVVDCSSQKDPDYSTAEVYSKAAKKTSADLAGNGWGALFFATMEVLGTGLAALRARCSGDSNQNRRDANANNNPPSVVVQSVGSAAAPASSRLSSAVVGSSSVAVVPKTARSRVPAPAKPRSALRAVGSSAIGGALSGATVSGVAAPDLTAPLLASRTAPGSEL